MDKYLNKCAIENIKNHIIVKMNEMKKAGR